MTKRLGFLSFLLSLALGYLSYSYLSKPQAHFVENFRPRSLSVKGLRFLNSQQESHIMFGELENGNSGIRVGKQDNSGQNFQLGIKRNRNPYFALEESGEILISGKSYEKDLLPLLSFKKKLNVSSALGLSYQGDSKEAFLSHFNSTQKIDILGTYCQNSSEECGE